MDQKIDVEELNYFRKHLSNSVGSVSRENIVTENGIPVLNNTDNTERFFDRRLYHYTGMIHEQLTPKRGTEITAYLLQTTILHTGYDMTDEERAAKYTRNFTLLKKRLEGNLKILISIINWEKAVKSSKTMRLPVTITAKASPLT